MNFIPLFPLNLVAYPHEKLNLHIFEERYRQLINECIDNKTTFGVPTYIDNQLKRFGTEMLISKVAKRYESGELDICTVGVRIFQIESFDNPVDGKLYAGGQVKFLQHEEISEIVDRELFEMVEEFYRHLQKRVDYSNVIPQPFSFRIAHKIGLSIEEEYELLKMPTEKQRQDFLKEHFKKILPIVSNLERTKEIIAMNGHFKNLDPLDF